MIWLSPWRSNSFIRSTTGTGEVRAWISVAAAMKRPAKVVEYVPAHCTQTGCGFVYWPAEA
jgi:hypothetical protein